MTRSTTHCLASWVRERLLRERPRRRDGEGDGAFFFLSQEPTPSGGGFFGGDCDMATANLALMPIDRITPARAGGWTHAITVEDTSFGAAKRLRFQLFIAEFKV